MCLGRVRDGTQGPVDGKGRPVQDATPRPVPSVPPRHTGGTPDRLRHRVHLPCPASSRPRRVAGPETGTGHPPSSTPQQGQGERTQVRGGRKDEGPNEKRARETPSKMHPEKTDLETKRRGGYQRVRDKCPWTTSFTSSPFPNSISTSILGKDKTPGTGSDRENVGGSGLISGSPPFSRPSPLSPSLSLLPGGKSRVWKEKE